VSNRRRSRCWNTTAAELRVTKHGATLSR